MRRLLILVFLALAFLEVNAQKERKVIREGNSLYEAKKYEKATTEYLKAKDIKANSFEAKFNLGDAMFKQKKYEDALNVFQSLSKTEKDRGRLGALYHNIGNTYLAMQKIDESIAAYEESLRNNPGSNETKYNLAYARMLKQQQKQNKQKNQNNKDQQNKDRQNKDQQNKDQQNKDQQNKDQQNKDQQNKDQQNKDQQNKDQQNKDQKDKQNKDQQDQNKQNQQNKDQQNKNQKEKGEQESKAKISKEDAKRLLDALGADEKKVQEKVQKAKAKAQKSKVMKVQKKW